MVKNGLILLGVVVLGVSLFFMERTRYTCDKCGAVLQPLEKFPEVYKCPREGRGFALDTAAL